MNQLPFADMHCDTLERSFLEGDDYVRAGDGMQSFEKMSQAGQLLQFYAIFFPRRRTWGKYFKEGMPFREFPEDEIFYGGLVDVFHRELALASDYMAPAFYADEVRKNREEGKASAILTIEDGRIVMGNMDRLKKLREDNVRAIALTWNDENCFGYPNSEDPAVMNKGLTPFGKEAVAVMEELDILVDVSHLSDGGFYDVAALAKKPFIASHSDCRALTDHPRNLTDDMIRVLAEKGGIAGLNFYGFFCNPTAGTGAKRKVTGTGTKSLTAGTDAKSLTADEAKRVPGKIDGMCRHLFHMWEVGGEDFPALGSDFDGINPAAEIADSTQVQRLFDELHFRGMPDRIIEKIAYQNVMRILAR